MKYWIIITACVILGAGLILLVANPLDRSASSQTFYEAMDNPPAKAREWSAGGTHFQWKSTLAENAKFGPLNIFYRTFGSKDNPALLMIHGFPTSSYDFGEIISRLRDDYFIVVLDTPGYGFSDKPGRGYKYSLFDNARLVDTLVQDVMKLDSFALLTHDKGDSVGLAFLDLYQQAKPRAYNITRHIILNGSIYLPLATLTVTQKLMINPVIGPLITRLIPPSGIGAGMGKKMYVPPLGPEEVSNLTSIFAYQGGVFVMSQTIKYLNERKKHEVKWLKALSGSDVPTTMIWGEKDPVARTAIADYVWENYLKKRKSEVVYWRIPCAGHYPQNDQPETIAKLVRQAMGETVAFDTATGDCQPQRVE